MMKRILLGIVILATVGLSACSQESTVANSNKTNNVTFTTLKNKQFTLKSLKGKWVILNYWASWCKPCHTEIPALNAFAKKHADQAIVLGVSYEQAEPDQIPVLVKKMNIKFTTLKYDPGFELGIEHVPGLPATYIINPEGKLVKTLLGEQTEKSLAKAIA